MPKYQNQTFYWPSCLRFAPANTLIWKTTECYRMKWHIWCKVNRNFSNKWTVQDMKYIHTQQTICDLSAICLEKYFPSSLKGTGGGMMGAIGFRHVKTTESTFTDTRSEVFVPTGSHTATAGLQARQRDTACHVRNIKYLAKTGWIKTCFQKGRMARRRKRRR